MKLNYNKKKTYEWNFSDSLRKVIGPDGNSVVFGKHLILIIKVE